MLFSGNNLAFCVYLCLSLFILLHTVTAPHQVSPEINIVWRREACERSDRQRSAPPAGAAHTGNEARASNSSSLRRWQCNRDANSTCHPIPAPQPEICRALYWSSHVMVYMFLQERESVKCSTFHSYNIYINEWWYFTLHLVNLV